ncbi:MAG: nicotinate phosphoribosyltransferase [Mycobacteriales bacterium]
MGLTAPPDGPAHAPSTALLTDRYELTMLAAALASGAAGRRCVFEVSTRRLPPGRRYGVLAGVGRLVEVLGRFRFGPAELDLLRAEGVVDAATANWLADFRFGGEVDVFAEGEAYFPGEPVAVVTGSFAECMLLETLVLSVLNHDSAVAAAAARMVGAAAGRPCLEMGARRSHELAAPATARAAYLAGFAGSSALEAARAYGIPTIGTSGHAFTLVHDGEREAFEAQVAALGAATTLLVDTFAVPEAVRTAVEVAGPGLGAVRLDSGDLAALAVLVRTQLDALGATGTRIVATSDLDEFSIAALAAAPIDAYGVGTAVATGSGAPTAGLVYKLVERDGIQVAKTSPGKVGRSGRHCVARRYGPTGAAVVDQVYPGPTPPPDPRERPLLHPLLRAGAPIPELADLALARERCARSLAELPEAARQLTPGEPALPVQGPPTPA